MRGHPLFTGLCQAARFAATDDHCPPDGWAVVSRSGLVHLNPRRRGTEDEWTFVLAHCLLHLGFDHLENTRVGTGSTGCEREWNAAACLAVNVFLRQIKVGKAPDGIGAQTPWDHLVGSAGDESRCAQIFRDQGLPLGLEGSGVGGSGPDLLAQPPQPISPGCRVLPGRSDWPKG